jgi:hypothetical protein
MAFFKVLTGRAQKPTLVGIANIASITQEEGQQLTFTMVNGESIRSSTMNFDELADLLPNRKILVVDLSPLVERAVSQRDGRETKPADPVETKPHNTGPSADPSLSSQTGA